MIKLPPSLCCGYFTFAVFKADECGRILPHTKRIIAEFENLLTDQGLDRMGANLGYLSNCQVGSGNATPTTSDTSLQTYVAGTGTTINTGQSNGGAPDYYSQMFWTFEFALGVAAGNLSEVGIGWATSGATLFSRALIVDGGGAPTTITVLSDEILQVTYAFRVYPNLSDTTDTINIAGIDYDYTLRASLVSTTPASLSGGWGWTASASAPIATIRSQNSGNFIFNGAIGTVTQAPSGSSTTASSVSSAAYGTNNLYREGTAVWNNTRVVSGGVRSVMFSFAWGCWQIEFDPVIPKTSLNELTLTYRHSWARKTI